MADVQADGANGGAGIACAYQKVHVGSEGDNENENGGEAEKKGVNK